MKKILIILALLLFSCSQQTNNIDVMPKETAQKTEKKQKEKDDINAIEESKFFEQNIDMSKVKIDSSAQINIISQIPFECFNLYNDSDLIELKYGKSMRNTISIEVPQNFFFNSIQAANDISEFAKTNPASVRGIFGNLLGITEVVRGTQKVLFGIIPRNVKIIDFRYETQISYPAFQILKTLVWKFNKRFDISLSENKITMKRRTDDFGATKLITLENIGTNDPVKMLNKNNELSAFLFKNSDLKLVRSDLQDFKGVRFDNFMVSAFLNPLLDNETKNILEKLVKNADYSNKLDYNLNTFTGEKSQGFEAFDKDSIIIIYDKNNLIAFETAMVVSQFLQEKTAKNVVAVADFGQRRLFFGDYDIVISANSANLDEQFLARKFSDSKIDLFEMKIYLVSMQKIITQSNIISNLEVAK